MKKLLFILVSVIMLAACGSEDTVDNNDLPDESENTGEVVTEIINEQEHNIKLVDNDELKIVLKDSTHERYQDYETKDVLFMTISIENKVNKTFNILLDDISIDGDNENYHIGFSETEIGPEEQLEVNASFYKDELADEKTLSFEEHVSGEFILTDFDNNRKTENFSEYIIEQ